MNILVIWSLIGLLHCAVAYEKHENKHHDHLHHAGRYHIRHHRTTEEDDSSPQPLTLPPATAAPLVNYNSLNLIFNLEKKILGFANVSENVGFVYVVREEGTVKILVDSKSGTSLRFVRPDNVTRIQTNNTKGEILTVFATILKQESENGSIPEGSQIDPTSEEALRILSEVYVHVARKGDIRSRSLKLFSKFVDKLKSLYLGPLNGILQGSSPVPLKQNLNRFLSISIGLKELFSRATGGLKAILEKGVNFEINPLYNGRNGAEVFVYILRQTGAKFNLATLWGRLLNDIEKVLRIIQLLGGGECTNGVDETFAFLSHIWSALNLRLPIPSLIKFLLEASSEENWSKADDGDFSSVLQDLKNITDEQSKKYDNSGLITPFVTFFSNLTANSLIQDGVNVSDLVTKWRRRDIIGGFRSVTEIILKFESPEKYSAVLFNSFTAFLNSTSDTNALKRLFPGVSLDQFTKQGSSLWDSISKSFNVDGLLKNSRNATDVLKGVPGFGEFSKIYNDSFGAPFNFTKILNGQTISDYLSKGFLWPYKWTSGIFHESEGFIKQIFWDPFKPLLSGINPFPGLFNQSTAVTSERSTSSQTKIVTESETEDDNSKATVSTSEVSENSEKTVTKTSTEIPEEKFSSQVEVEVSTESKATTELEFKQHHHLKHHEKNHHHEVNRKNERAHHESKGHHDIKKNEIHEKKSHSHLRHNSGEKYQNRRDEKRHIRHRQEKEHDIHSHSNA